MENDDNSAYSLLQPELLSEKQLREILTNRCVARNLKNCTKNDLVELYRDVALPLPQRVYGESRREKILSKKQQKRRKISFSNDEATTSCVVSSSTEMEKKPDLVTEEKAADRLKPPLDTINYKRRFIRLSDTSKQRVSNELDKIVIKSKDTKQTENSSLTPESNVSKRHCPSSEENGKEEKNYILPSGAVKLKRDILDDQSKEDKNDEEKPTQKKRQKIVISW